MHLSNGTFVLEYSQPFPQHNMRQMNYKIKCNNFIRIFAYLVLTTHTIVVANIGWSEEIII